MREDPAAPLSLFFFFNYFFPALPLFLTSSPGEGGGVCVKRNLAQFNEDVPLQRGDSLTSEGESKEKAVRKISNLVIICPSVQIVSNRRQFQI